MKFRLKLLYLNNRPLISSYVSDSQQWKTACNMGSSQVLVPDSEACHAFQPMPPLEELLLLGIGVESMDQPGM